jgi:hypothetical protein
MEACEVIHVQTVRTRDRQAPDTRRQPYLFGKYTLLSRGAVRPGAKPLCYILFEQHVQSGRKQEEVGVMSEPPLDGLSRAAIGAKDPVSHPQTSSLACLGLVSALLMLAACDSSPDEVQARGRVLQLSATPFRTVSEVGYRAPEGHYVIRPQSDGRVLVLTRLSVINANAALASLLIDERTLSVEDARGRRYQIVNPWVQRETIAQATAKNDAFLPLLWGVTELREGYQVSGWVMFELPADAPARGLIWNQVETIRLSFPDKAG